MIGGKLGEFVRFNDFVDAEYFLWLRSELARNDLISDYWLPPTALYLRTRTPKFLMTAQQVERANAIATALGLAGGHVIRSVLKIRGADIKRIFPESNDLFPFHGFDIDEIGTVQ